MQGSYIGMGRSKVDVGIVRVSDSTSFSIRIVGCCEIGEVASNPGVYAHDNDEGSK